MAAQGNALGRGRRRKPTALKGRNKRLTPTGFSPFQGLLICVPYAPQGVALGCRIAALWA